MSYYKRKVVCLVCLIVLIITGCGVNNDEQIKGAATVKQYKEQITENIRNTFGDEAKIIDMTPSYEMQIGSPVLSFKLVATNNVLVDVKLNNEEFGVVYSPTYDLYGTNKNEVTIEKSFSNYVVKAMGSDSIISISLVYGSNYFYGRHNNYVDPNIMSYEQLIDNGYRGVLLCFLKDTDVDELKKSQAFQYLEDKIENSQGDISIAFVNVKNDYISDKEKMAKILDKNAFTVRYITVDDRDIPALASDYSKENPKNTYCIRAEKGLLISLVY